MLKAQSDILSSLLIIIIVIALVSTAYLWGVPLIQKQQDTSVVERLFANFNPDNSNSITRKMQFIVNQGGDELYTVSTDGSWKFLPYDSVDLENNSIQFSILAKVSDFAANQGWLPVTGGVDCDNILPGILGIDTSYVVCRKAESQPEGRYLITYKVAFRELVDTATGNEYKVNLVKASDSSPTTSSFKSVRITKGQIIQQQNEIITELKILLQ